MSSERPLPPSAPDEWRTRLLQQARRLHEQAADHLARSRATEAEVTEFLKRFGPTAHERLRWAMRIGHLLPDDKLAKGSQLALQDANDHVEADLPCAVVLKYDPRNKNAARRQDVRLLTGGTVSLQLDLGPAVNS